MLLLLWRLVSFTFCIFDGDVEDLSFIGFLDVAFIESLVCLFVKKSIHCSVILMFVLGLGLGRSNEKENHLDILES